MVQSYNIKLLTSCSTKTHINGHMMEHDLLVQVVTVAMLCHWNAYSEIHACKLAIAQKKWLNTNT